MFRICERLLSMGDDPFLARTYRVEATGAAKTPLIAEANPDALRLWVLPMPRGRRYSAVLSWMPGQTEKDTGRAAD
jgi:hypothetical protein